MDEALRLNGYVIADSFNYELALDQIGIPDSVSFGGPSIIEEFGADDYWMHYGRSFVDAGHGYILSVEIFDQSLSINNVRIGDARETVTLKLNKNFSDKEKVEFITHGDDVLGFIFDSEGTLESMYYSRPL